MMKKLNGGFALQNPNNGKYIQFDGATIIFETIEEIVEFKNRYRLFFAKTYSLPQIVAVDDFFINEGESVIYNDIDKERLDEAEVEVKEAYKNDD